MGKILNTASNIISKVPIIGKPVAGLVNDVTDTVLGKEDPGTPNQVIDLASPQGRALQGQALDQYGQFLGQDTGQMAAAQSAAQESQARQNVADQQMKAKELVAQRGLGGTSMGLNAILGQNQGLQNQLGAIRAQAPGLAQQMKQQNLNFATGGINQILGEQGSSKILSTGQASQGRQGGLAPLVGGALGAVYGGPTGAMAGMQAGNLLTKV